MDLDMDLINRNHDILNHLRSNKYLDTIFKDVCKSGNNRKNYSERLIKFINDIRALEFKFITVHKSMEIIQQSIDATKLSLESIYANTPDEENRTQIFWESYKANILGQLDIYADTMVQTLYNIRVEEENKVLKLESDILKNAHHTMGIRAHLYKKYANKEYISICQRYAIQQLCEHGNMLHIFRIELSYYDMHSSLANTLLEGHMDRCIALKNEMSVNIQSMLISNMLLDEHELYILKLNTKYNKLYQARSIINDTEHRSRSRNIHEINIYRRWRSLSPNYEVLD